MGADLFFMEKPELVMLGPVLELLHRSVGEDTMDC